MLNELEIQCFLTVARNASFTVAGKELFMTRQAVSRQIQRLEESLGLRLFERSTNKVSLTGAGLAFLELAQSFMQGVTELRDSAAQADGTLPRVTAGHISGLRLSSRLMEVIAACRGGKLGFELDFERWEPEPLIKKLLRGELDVIFVYANVVMNCPKLSELVYLPFEQVELALTVSRDHPLATDTATYRDFKNEVCIDWNPDASVPRSGKGIARDFDITDVNASFFKMCRNFESAATEVEMGNGVMMMNRAHEFCQRPGIRSYLMDGHTEVFCVWRAENTEPSLGEFVRLVAKYALKR